MKKQGYNDELDDSLGRKHGSKKQNMAQRRADSENMEKAKDKRKFSGDKSMDEGKDIEEEMPTKMKKSELKEMIKAAMMAEGRLFKEELLNFEGDDMYPEIKGDMKRYYKMDVPMNVIKDWADDYFSDRYDDKDDYEFETSAREDFLDHLEDKFVSGDSKPKWWNLTEAEEVDVEDNEDIDVDIDKDVTIDDESTEADIDVKASVSGESEDVEAVQGLLTKALQKATELGDEKLTDQIGNTITYFTRAHISNVSEADLDMELDPTTDTHINPEAAAVIGLDEEADALNESIAFPMWNKIK